jgi:hypothetical protein
VKNTPTIEEWESKFKTKILNMGFDGNDANDLMPLLTEAYNHGRSDIISIRRGWGEMYRGEIE